MSRDVVLGDNVQGMLTGSSLFCVAFIALGPTLLHSSTVFQLCILTRMTRHYTQHVVECIVSSIVNVQVI